MGSSAIRAVQPTDGVSRPPRYDYLSEVEQGGWARSYLASDRERGFALVVVHLAPPAAARDEELRVRFGARASALLQLEHPNLVRTLDYAVDERWCYWVSEVVQGQPLSRLLAKMQRGKRALTTRQILTVACDVLRGLEHIHGLVDAAGVPRPIVHRNLCPANVLVSYEGTVKLSDGVSCNSPDLTTTPLDGLAQQIAYLAPECCGGGPVDARSDVYAIGAILWEALAGRPRPAGATLQQSIETRLQGADPDLQSVCPEVLPELAAVTRRALAKDPGDRYQSARALRDDLEVIARGDALRHERGGLFGFMCNHFFQEHAALLELLHDRDADLLAVSSGPDEGPSARAIRFAEPTLAVSETTRVTLIPRFENFGSSSMDGRKRLGVWLVSVAAIAALGVTWVVWPSPPPQDSTATAVRGLTPAPASAAAPAVSPRANLPSEAPPSDLAPRGASISRDGISNDGLSKDLSARDLSGKDGVARGALPKDARDPSQGRGTDAPPGEPLRLERTSPPEADSASSDDDSIAPSERSGSRRSRVRRTAASRESAAARTSRGAAPPPRATSSLEDDDAATLSALGEASADGTGVDLRALKRRAPRAIDKQDPYSR